MTQRTILITGCSSGIGYYCAHALREKGYRVFATARKIDDVKRLAQQGFEAYQLDLDNSQSIQKAVDAIMIQTQGRLYALFNNGAYGQPGAVEDLSREVLEAQFQTNLFGTHELTNSVLPYMRAQGEGRIIQNSSVLGIIALRFRGAYNASKFALEGLSDTLRLELEGSGIFVSLIEPGPVRSHFRQNALSKFTQHIQTEKSAFKEAYHDKLSALQSAEDVPFTLDESAVFDVLLKALESKHPKARYRVTTPTTLFWFLKRILSTKYLDTVLKKVE
jgi:NAD(P)-dependent dehydrogenase (short-subunit alcohol dehydrogenase family)